MAVTVSLADDLDISRGDMLCRPHNMPTVAQDIDAEVCWMDETAPMAKGASTRSSTRPAGPGDGPRPRLPHRRQHAPSRRGRRPSSRSTRSGGCSCAPQPMFIDPYPENRQTGSFILVDEGSNRTVGAGIIGRATVAG